MSLFYVDEKDLVILHPDAVRLCPELGLLSEKEVAFLVLAYDYKSPFKQYPERVREQQAMWKVFGMDQPNLLTKHSMIVGKEKYISLQFNRKIEYIKTFTKKIEQLTRELESAATATEIRKISENIASLENQIVKWENEVDTDVQNKGVIKGGASLSWLEEGQRNMKQYAHWLTTKPATIK